MRRCLFGPLLSLVAACSLSTWGCGGDSDSQDPTPSSSLGGQGGTAGSGGTQAGGSGGTEEGGSGGADVGGSGGADVGGSGGTDVGGSGGTDVGGSGGTDVGGTGGGSSTCTPGTTQSCYSGPAESLDVGPCHAGTQVCNAEGTGYEVCEGEVIPQAEDCSTPIDEDCNGQTPSCSTTLVDLRVDVNRNGTVDLLDPTEDADEDTWDSSHGAIFLANIDDDDNSCSDSGSDSSLASCHDASNTTIDGPDDLLDLARLEVVPWPNAPDTAVGTIQVSSPGASHVRFFKGGAGSFQVFDPASAKISAAELRDGVELAIEGKDILRDASWDGYVDITLQVDPGSGLESASDKVRMRLAPMLLRHHLHDAETVYATNINDQDSIDFRDDLSAAMKASGVTSPLRKLNIDDQWTQDLFETAYMSMPAAGGTQKIIHVNIRSANYTQGGLRDGGRIVYTELRGKDVAGVTQYDSSHSNNMDSLNSFGNTETIPPYSYGGQSYPAGRILRGATSTYYPDESVDAMFEAQGAQPTVFLDTAWLLVGHVDETVTFIKADSPRGWAMMINDAPLARQLLQQLEDDGHGSAVMFAGMEDYYYHSAAVTVSQTLDDTDLMNTNAWAAVQVDEQEDYLKQVTGLTDTEIVKIPFLWTESYNYAVAYMPGMINGIMLKGDQFGPPDPHGPVVQGKDIFKDYVEETLTPRGVSVHWIEDWYLYHILDGEVHCGSNTTRVVPSNYRWWEGV